MMLRTLSAVLLVASTVLQGCAVRDRRDAAWDPAPNRALFEQIPNWQGEAGRVCGGHLSPEERQRTGRSARC
jgi:hypothetical protein